MMFDPNRQTILQNRIPNVKDLCRALGFGNLRDRTEQDLKDSTHNWRKRYLTADGTPGKDLTDWRSVKTQEDLWRMSKDYLHRGAYGIIHWPSKGNSSPRSVPEYPRDEEKIVDLLIQLFWKENVNQAHNARFPDRGRKPRESGESAHSSATLSTSSASGHPHQQYPPDRVVPQHSVPAALARSAPRAESPRVTPQPRLTLSSVERTTKSLPCVASTQGSCTFHAHDHSTQTRINSPNINSITTQHIHTGNRGEVFDYRGSDSEIKERQRGHIKPSKKIIVLKLKANPQAGNKDESHNVSQKRAPIADMHSAPSKSLVTPTKLRRKRDKPATSSKSPSAQIEDQISSPEPRESKRKDVDGDEEDAEYTPQRRHKRHRANSRNHTDKVVVAKSKPMRRRPSPVRDSEERPIVRSVEHRGARLPTACKGKRKPPIKSSSLGQRRSRTAAPGANDDIDDLLDEGLEYIRTLELPGALSTDGAGNQPPFPCTIDSQGTPGIKIEQNVAHTDSASRKATLEDAAALQTTAKDMKSLTSSTKPTVPVSDHNHPSTGPKYDQITDEQHVPPNKDTSDTNGKPEIGPPQHVQELGREARHISRDTSLTEERYLLLPGHDVPEQANPLQPLPSCTPSTDGQCSIPPDSGQPRQRGPTPHRPATQPHISYYVFAMPNGRLTLLQWPDGSLVGKTIETLFDEVESLACRRDIKSIFFKLTTSQKDAVCVVKRSDVGSFEVMKKKFSSLINEDLKTGNTEFEIELDPGHGAPQGQVRVRDDDVDPGFSFG